jgi:halimadienyl-diphosphate synthase
VTLRDETLALDLPGAAGDLITGLVVAPWGQVSPSVYETARLVALAPWLTAHRKRVEYLISAQRADGGWGAPGGYALVPTLSAAEAILALLERPDDGGVDGSLLTLLTRAADRALGILFGMLAELDGDAIPDTPAADLITTSLVDSINLRLQHLRDSSSPPFAVWAGDRQVQPPEGMDGTRLAMARNMLDGGAQPPEKLLHALEAFGGAARGAHLIRPTDMGTVGASPAATAAWIDPHGSMARFGRARRYLETVVHQHDGPVPCGIPITVFERGWVLAILAEAGLVRNVPAEVVVSLETAREPGGTPAGEGLPKDADTTSVALYALGLLGSAYPPDSLWDYDAGTHFCTWRGEDGFSVTVNAHVLDAFGQYVSCHPHALPRYPVTVKRLTRFLLEQQRADGGWLDRWHASPYYAAVCCALALDRYGGMRARGAVRGVVEWVLATQRVDGSWGRWEGTAEETAYAMQILLLTRPGKDDHDARTAAALGRSYLLRSIKTLDSPQLWHDKDLYQPVSIVRAAVVAALHLSDLSQKRAGRQ